MADTLYLKQMECGPMQNYVYLIGDPATRQAAVVDPAWEVERIVQAAQQDDYTITKVLITHTHQDHTGGEIFGHYIPGVVERPGSRPGSMLRETVVGRSYSSVSRLVDRCSTVNTLKITQDFPMEWRDTRWVPCCSNRR